MILPRHRSHRTAGSFRSCEQRFVATSCVLVTLFGSLKRWPRPVPTSVERGHDQGSVHGRGEGCTQRVNRLQSSGLESTTIGRAAEFRVLGLAIECGDHAGCDARIQTHLWIQGFRIPAGREEDITKSAIAAGQLGIDVIAIWGFDACESMSFLSCERPQMAWAAFLKAIAQLRDRHE